MAGVPDDPVAGRLEQPMERDRELDHAERRAQVAASRCDRLDDLLANLIGQLGQLRVAHAAQVGRAAKRWKNGQGSMLLFWEGRAPRRVYPCPSGSASSSDRSSPAS